MNKKDFDGYISHEQIVSGLGSRNRQTAKGVRISLPATDTASTGYLNTLEDEIRSVLRLIQPGMGMQLRWSQDGDFSEYLNAYYERTEQAAVNPWTRRQRQQHFIRYAELQKQGMLRRKQVSLFLHSPLPVGKGRGGTRYEDSLKASANGLDALFNEIGRSIKRLGGSTTVLCNDDLFEECYRHLNPSTQKIAKTELLTRFQQDCSILENCLSGQLAPIEGGDAGFFYDGHYHGFLTLKSLPQTTTSGIADFLTGMPVGNFSIILNIEPLDVVEEVDLEEGNIARLERSLRHHRKPQMEETVSSKRERVQRLLSGEVMPFQLQFLIHAWAPSRETLSDKLGALKGAFSRMQGAKYWEMMLPTTARNCFLATIPGMPFRENDFFLKTEDHTLANLLPISGGSNDSLQNTEAIFHGTNGSLLGVSTFAGAKGHETPLHMAVAGMTGGGKSVGVIEILTQTEAGFGFTCILDNGLSYATYVRVFDENARTLILEPDGCESLNYLDPGGRALTKRHLSNATAVLHLMAGHSRDKGDNLRRSAIMTALLRRFYNHWTRAWLKANPSQFEQLKKRVSQSSSEQLVLPIEEAAEKSFDSKSLDHCFSMMKRTEVPRHSDLHDWMQREIEEASKHRKELEHLVTVMADWRADDGKNGPILDGFNTVDFSGKIVHIELGRLSQASEQLRELATFVITTQIRSEITYRPRSERKRVIFEELGSFLELDGAKEIVRDYFERGRKYNCWNVAVIQQSSNIPADLARSVLGNCRQGIFFRQEYEHEVRALQEALRLPPDTATSLLSLPDPTPEEGAPFIYWKSQGAMPLISKGFNVTTPETLYVAGSSGPHFEERESAMSKYPSFFEGVIAETEKMTS